MTESVKKELPVNVKPVKAEDGRSTISVNGNATVLLSPDVVKLICILRSNKPTVDDVRKSIDRRKDYMVTHSKKAGVSEKSNIRVCWLCTSNWYFSF